MKPLRLLKILRLGLKVATGKPIHLGQLTERDASESFPIATSIIPIPNQNMMTSIGAESTSSFLSAGETWANLITDLAVPQASILDIGCGCSRVARFLAENPNISRYIGFDTIKALIDWNNTFILPHCIGNFEYHHIDIYSEAYNPRGHLNASEITFPATDSSIDLVFAASLFTHLLEEDAQHYLLETERCLKHSGYALVSILTPNRTKEGYSGNEFRVETQISYFVSMIEKANMKLQKDFGDVNGQRILLLQKS
jgi:SAM-dependent methyltransferase